MTALCWDGRNACEISAAMSPDIEHGPHELHGGIYLHQRDGAFRLSVPARHGPVLLDIGDYVVCEPDGSWVRLSPEQFLAEYPGVADG